MRHMTKKTFLRICIFASLLYSLGYSREFKDTQGRTIEAELISSTATMVSIRRSDGRVFTLPLQQFSQEDQVWIRAQGNAPSQNSIRPAASSKVTYETLNTLFGCNLWGDHHVWDDDVAAVAKRLSWPQESNTESLSSFRLYSRGSNRILDATAYSSTLYGEDGVPGEVSIVFANKGDLVSDGSLVGSPEISNIDEIKEILNEKIEQEAEKLSHSLSEILGSPKRTKTGKGGLKERVSRWDWNDHAILLSEQEGEYLTCRIVPVERADSRGSLGKISKREIRERLSQNIQNHDNQDVLIKNIPMVDQGPKGYCVPATFERYLRYMGISADMYVLAMAGETGIGGGTRVYQIVESTEALVEDAGLGLEAVDIDLEDLDDISEYIDQGLPIMWTMFSGRSYSELAGAITRERAQATEAAWSERISDYRERARQLRPDQDASHICMIVGYNPETQEVAVSDSWGKAYELRWIPLALAQRVTQRFYYVIER